jgi:exonuclease-1
MLKHFGVTPYMVFDGDYLPSKAGTEASRAKRREESKKAGLELLKAGKPSQAHLELQKAIDVTPEMARHLIEELKKAQVPYVVAPYEADAQMVYLERQGIISGIISEDSDLLVFGCKRLLTKLDQHGQCIEISRKDFCLVREISLTGWTDTEFRHMAIFSGCDYLDSVSNMGLKTAYRMIRKHKTPEKVIRMLQFDGKFKVSENYLAAFKQAELTFLHQRVYCPVKQELVFLTEPDPKLDVDNMPFIGSPVDPPLARAIAAGDVNPITKEAIVLVPLPGRSPKRRASSSLAVAMGDRSKPFGKPIDAYFKGNQRIPLGEMDPNCFVVEPGQVANLTQNGLLPRVFPLPRPYVEPTTATTPARPYTTTPRLRRRATEPLTSLLGLPSVDSSQARRRTTGPLTNATSASDNPASGHLMRPPKKPRLCADGPPNPDEAATAEKSRFFFPSTSKPKAKTADTILFSDDSIEEALMDLPDVDEWERRKSVPRKSLTGRNEPLQIFDERVVEQETVAEANITESDEIIPESDIEVPVSSPPQAPQEEAIQQSFPSETPIRPALRQFSYTPQVSKQPSSSGVRMAHGLPTPASSMQKPRSTTTDPSRDFSTSSTPMLTPLQRIGAQALQRGKGTFTSPISPKPSAKPKKDENRRKSYAEMPVNPAFVPLPKVDVAEVEALNRAYGSEDQIIPDSDGENDADAFDAGEEGGRLDGEGRQADGRLNLSRFLYL